MSNRTDRGLTQVLRGIPVFYIDGRMMFTSNKSNY